MSVTVVGLSPRTNEDGVEGQRICCQETAKETGRSCRKCDGMVRMWWAASEGKGRCLLVDGCQEEVLLRHCLTRHAMSQSPPN
jgi:hypothetical protein